MRLRVRRAADPARTTNKLASSYGAARHRSGSSLFRVSIMPVLAATLFTVFFRQDHLVSPTFARFTPGVFVGLDFLLSLRIVERPLAAFLSVVAGVGRHPSFSIRGFARRAIALRFGQVVTSFGGTSEHFIFIAHPKNYSHKKMGGGSREASEKFWFRSILKTARAFVRPPQGGGRKRVPACVSTAGKTPSRRRGQAPQATVRLSERSERKKNFIKSDR